MKASVVMVTYNQERFIAQAIDSVLAQETDFDYELVIGEDCSTDGTSEICAEYADRNPERVRLLRREKNMGAERNFVDAYLGCSSEYIAILEGDDYWTSPHKLQRQVDALDRHPEWSVCFHRVRCFQNDGSGEAKDRPFIDHEQVFTLEDLLAENFIQTCSLMVRKGLVQTFPQWFFRHQPRDWALGILHARHGTIGYLPEVMAAYRLHPEGCWSGRDPVETAGDTIELLRALSGELSRSQARAARSKMAELLLERAVASAERGAPIDALLSVARSIREHPLNGRAFGLRRCGMIARALTPGFYRLVRGLTTRVRMRQTSETESDVRSKESEADTVS